MEIFKHIDVTRNADTLSLLGYEVFVALNIIHFTAYNCKR